MFKIFKKKEDSERVFHFVGDCIELNFIYNDDTDEEKDIFKKNLS